MVAKTQFNLALAAALGAWTAPALAQPLERVEITGSSIKRIPSETALPVQTVTKADIARSGAQTVAELIQSLPAVQGFTQVSEAVGGGGGGFAGASVHGIGEARTLVLLNGRRIATWAGQTVTGEGAAIDLNSIPLAAVERVELLTDGASALYGTDAIAGVINFILKRDLTTGEASVVHAVPKGGAGKTSTVSVTKGFGDLSADGFNALMALSAEKQSRMVSADRKYARTGLIPFTKDGQQYAFVNGSIRTAPANYELYDGASGYDALGNPYLSAQGACPQNHFKSASNPGTCAYDYSTQVDLMPESRRESFFGSVATKIDRHTLSADLALNRFTLTSHIAPAPVDMLIPAGSALYNRYLPVFNASGSAPANSDLYAYWRAVDAGLRTTQNTTEAGHLAVSLTGTLEQWDYSAAVTHSSNRWVERHLGGWLMQNEQDAAIASGAFDPFLMPGQQSAAGNAAIAGMQHVGTFKTQTSTLDALELRGSRDLFKLDGGGSVQLGTGLDLRRERVKNDPSDIARGVGNNIAGDSSQDQAYDLSRTIWGAYAELLVAVTKAFEVTGALRHDQYSDFGKTDNFKLAARYQPSRDLLFRGSLGTGFRAPSVPQVAASRQLYGVSGQGYSCPTAALQALQAADASVVCEADGTQYRVVTSGNTELKPEKSRQWSLGLRAEPEKWLSSGVDFWGIFVKDRIGQLAEDAAMDSPASYLKNFTTYVDPGTGRHLVALYLPNENLGDERYFGADWDAKVGFNSAIGKTTLLLQWTHLFRYDYQRVKGGDWYSNLNSFNDSTVTFRNLIRLSGTLVTGAFENTLTVNHKPGYRDQAYSAADAAVYSVNADGSLGSAVAMSDHRVSSYTTVDWQMKYEATKTTNVTLGAFNLFDRAPPMSIRTSGSQQLGYDNRYADARGRTLYGRLTMKF